MFKSKLLMLSSNVCTYLIDTTYGFQNDIIRVCTGRKPHDVLVSVIRQQCDSHHFNVTRVPSVKCHSKICRHNKGFRCTLGELEASRITSMPLITISLNI